MFGRDKTKKDDYMLNTLLKMFNRGQLNKNHPLQRKADQWSKQEKSGLVATIIKQEDIDPIKICEQIISDTEFILWLIDGIQRLTTCQEYKAGMFKISKTIEFPYAYYQEDGQVISYDLRGKYYHELPEELKDQFDSCSITVVKHLDCTDEEIAYHIRRYNNQKNMNTNQKNVLVMPNVVKFIKNISYNHRFFDDNGKYTEKEKNNGIIDRIVAETVMAMFHLQDWKKGKNMSKYLNDNSKKEEFDSFELELDRLSKIIDQDTVGSLFNSKNSFLFFTLFHKFVNYNLPDEQFVDFLKAFQAELHNRTFKKYDNETFDMYDNNRSTKDKKVVMTKLDMLETLMREYLGITEEVEEYSEQEDTYEKTKTLDISTEETNSTEQKSIIEFIKDNVYDGEIPDEDDISYYEEDLELLTLNVDNNSRLLEPENHNSLIGIVAYSYKKDERLDEWIVDFFSRNNTYIKNQKENYTYMVNDFKSYLEHSNAA